jgi:hypothetical protein
LLDLSLSRLSRRPGKGGGGMGFLSLTSPRRSLPCSRSLLIRSSSLLRKRSRSLFSSSHLAF